MSFCLVDITTKDKVLVGTQGVTFSWEQYFLTAFRFDGLTPHRPHVFSGFLAATQIQG